RLARPPPPPSSSPSGRSPRAPPPRPARRVHSRPTRHAPDLAIQGRPTVLHLTAAYSAATPTAHLASSARRSRHCLPATRPTAPLPDAHRDRGRAPGGGGGARLAATQPLKRSPREGIMLPPANQG